MGIKNNRSTVNKRNEVISKCKLHIKRKTKKISNTYWTSFLLLLIGKKEG